MLKVALLLLIAAGLAIFTLQNLAPIALVVLGVKTLALPLAVWVVGSLAAGALTSLILAGLVNLAFRSTGRMPRSTTASTSKPPRSPWSAVGNDRTDRTPRQQTPRTSREDWGATARNDWEDWDEPAEPTRRSPAPKTEIRDRADEDWANWEGYENTEPRDRPPVNIPRRTDFEAPQTPRTQRQSGSVYSQSYRDEVPERKPEKEIYDAEYRVLIPPYHATPEPVSPPPPPPSAPQPEPAASDDDDWDLGDLLDDPKPSDRP